MVNRGARPPPAPGPPPLPARATGVAEPPPPEWLAGPPFPFGGGRQDVPPSSATPAPAGLFAGVSLAPLAQFWDTYILASAPDGLVILDQHAAHERILYERLLAESRSGGVVTQKLLFPVTVEVTPAERVAFEGSQQSFQALGFSIAPL